MGWLVHPCHPWYEKPRIWFSTNYNQYDRHALTTAREFFQWRLEQLFQVAAELRPAKLPSLTGLSRNDNEKRHLE